MNKNTKNCNLLFLFDDFDSIDIVDNIDGAHYRWFPKSK